jgi:MSHA biogenesis protein MshK
MRNSCRKRIMQSAIALPLLCITASAWTEKLPDPTRPPVLIDNPQSDAAASQYTGLVLQSVMISPHRKMAIINGQTVKLGEKFDGAQLVGISESEVVLRHGKTLQTLKLFPNINKRPFVDIRKKQNAAMTGK